MADTARSLPASREFTREFRTLLGARSCVPFDQFMQLALYHPTLGYYRRGQTRVGYAPGTDFFTATSSGAVFGELIVAAIEKQLGEHGQQASDYTFAEIGAEPEGGILKNVAHPFRAAAIIRIGEPITLTGRCIVFSNELFDAQPCRRFVFRSGAWRELGVSIDENDALQECIVPESAPLTPLTLPEDAAEEYHLDLPLASATLARTIVQQPWTGLFLACDYGKSWTELATATPAGTARAYVRHTQSNDLLAQPGEQDLTCHVCWDWLSEVLSQARFSQPALEFQESFFVHHAGDHIARIMAAEATRMSQRKLAIMQLLHPAHLGQKFQVLHGWRE